MAEKHGRAPIWGLKTFSAKKAEDFAIVFTMGMRSTRLSKFGNKLLYLVTCDPFLMNIDDFARVGLGSVNQTFEVQPILDLVCRILQ